MNDADLRAKLDDAKARVREFGATDATATLSVSDEKAHAALDDIRVQLEEIDKSTTDVRLELEDGSIAERLDELSAKLDEFGAKREDPKLGLRRCRVRPETRRGQGEARRRRFLVTAVSCLGALLPSP